MPTTVHTFPIRVYYEDTDFSGVVYHANYLHFLERGRSEFLREIGLHHRALYEGTVGAPPFGFVVRAVQIEFLAPARMDDLLTVETRVRQVGGASARIDQRVLREEAVLLTASVRVAVVANGHTVRWPPHVRKLLSSVVAPNRAAVRDESPSA